jgi:DNA-binding MarR family transcriptional regulator
VETVTVAPEVIDDEALAVWGDFLRFHATVTDQLERELLAGAGMPLTWFDVLLHLAAAPSGRLRMQELAAAVVLSRSGLTRVVDRLEAAGFVERTSCPSDRRGTNAEITPAGRAALRAARPVHLAGVAEHFAQQLSPAQLRALGAALRRLLDAVGAPVESCGG